MTQRGFASDNTSGVHPNVLAAIASANTGHTPAYGDDHWTAEATTALREAFECEAEVLLCFGGTGANVISLASVTRPHQAVLCAESAHLWDNECAAPERFIGAKLIPLAHHQGKLTASTLVPHLQPGRGVHNALPRVVTVTQPTEFGTLYSLAELRELADFAHQHGLLLHVDGARFANAAAALNCTLAELGPGCGVDILSFGGTKNGLMGAEAVLFFRPELAAEAEYARKQAMQLASKMRFVAAQFIAYMDGELWRDLATQANQMTARLTAACQTINGFELSYPAPCNMSFPKLNPRVLSELSQAHYFYTWDEANSVARWVTSFDTTTDDIDQFADAVAQAWAG